jgi:Rps23 Pro-64 3,4-dihydroxylase Tpa1-like proline 4-hydroxylase
MFFVGEIPNFLSTYYPQIKCEDICEEFSNEKEDYYIYDNPLEKKKALKFLPPKSQKVLDACMSKELINVVSNFSKIHGLEADPYLHGAGLHLYENGSFLTKHLDYSIHPKTGKERRINLILYLNDWDPKDGGALEMYDIHTKQIIRKIYPRKDLAVIFETNDYSLHGVELLKCQESLTRKILTCFYVSNARPNITVRHKAFFYPDDPELRDLAKKRSETLLN